MTYLETNLLAQDYYYKTIKVQNGRFKELYKETNSYYDKKFEEGNFVNNVDYKIKKVKETLNDYLKSGFDINADYKNSDFISKMAELNYLEKSKQKQERMQKEEDLITETFGEFSEPVHSKNQRISRVKGASKSSKELIKERNERLAILYKLREDNKLNDDTFTRKVIAVRRFYERDVQSQLVVEAKSLEVNTNNKSSLLKLKQLLKNIKNIFKIGKPISNIDNQVATETINKEFAALALSEVGSILIDSDNNVKVSEAIECLKDANSIKASIPDIKLSAETNKIVDAFYEERLHNADKTAYKTVYKNDDGSYRVEYTAEQNAERKKDTITRERFSFSSALNKYNGTKTEQQVQDNETDMLNYMIKNYKHTRKMSGNFKDGIQVEYIFEDAKVQKSYLELQSMFKYQKSMLELNSQANKELETKSNDVATNLEQNAGAIV